MEKKANLVGCKVGYFKPIISLLHFNRDNSGYKIFICASESNESYVQILKSNLYNFTKKDPLEFWSIYLGRFLGYPNCCIK